jgi:hypothetical protein
MTALTMSGRSVQLRVERRLRWVTWTGFVMEASFETTKTVSINNTKTKALSSKMSSSGHKRIIRREEGDTPRTQSEYFPSDDIGDAFFSDEAPGAVANAMAPLQHVDENAQIMQDLRLDGCCPTRYIQGGAMPSELKSKSNETINLCHHRFHCQR